jgi:energy-converting hydrogenase B subunit D
VIPLQVVTFLLVAVAGTAVVLTRDVARQVLVNAVYGLTLIVLFLVLQAPDVALSAIVAGTTAFPLILLAAIVKDRERE